jgi:diacylglycerol kinase (ATP)
MADSALSEQDSALQNDNFRSMPTPDAKPGAVTGPATLIVNARARTGQQAFEQTRNCLKANGITLRDECALEDPSKLSQVVRGHLHSGAKRILIGGGDGTLRTVAGLLTNTDATMGVIPLGTVNDFARNLGIEPTVEAACKVIAGGNSAAVDIGQANDDFFIITASLGFSAQSQLSLKPNLKKIFGPFGYFVASLLALRQLRDLKVTVRRADGGETEGDECVDAVQVGVIKGHYWMGGKVEVPNVDLTTDCFAFYAVPARRHRSFISMARHLRHGDFFHMPGLRAFPTADVTLETPTPQPLVLDGDLCGQTPVRLRVLCNALRVFVPADFSKAK